MTDCSVGSNPLAQLNKQTQQNNTFTHRSGFQGHSGGGNGAFREARNAVSESGKQHLDAFSTSSMIVDNGMQRMKLDEAVHSSGQRMGAQPWTQEFRDSSVTNSVNNNVQQRNAANRVQELHKFQYSPMTNLNNVAPLRPYNNVIRERQNAYGLSDDKIAWSDKFDELEKEVSQKWGFKDGQENVTMDEDVNLEQVYNERADDGLNHEGTDYQKEFQNVWDSIQEDTEEMLSYHDDYDEILANTDFERSFLGRRAVESVEYKFEHPSENMYINNPNAYQIGCVLMENGAKLSDAALAFEAAVKQDPKHVDAWLRLGLVQIQNEKELNGMSALENCLKLDPNNLEAMKNLAISYINEGYDMSAYNMLDRWADTKYPGVYNREDMTNDQNSQFTEHVNMNGKITKRFLSLVNKMNVVDADVQLCLGLLFYANDEFDRTIDCFQAALKVNPNDELLWNRLGASLANSNRSEEAIQAYHRALQLKPSFVRARYNLAVSSMNIGCYKEAAEHLLTALSMHEVEGNLEIPDSRTSVSSDVSSFTSGFKPTDNLVETLKRVFIAMNRDDLLDRVGPGMDLSQFRGEFNF